MFRMNRNDILFAQLSKHIIGKCRGISSKLLLDLLPIGDGFVIRDGHI